MKQCCLCGKTGHESSDCKWAGNPRMAARARALSENRHFESVLQRGQAIGLFSAQRSL